MPRSLSSAKIDTRIRGRNCVTTMSSWLLIGSRLASLIARLQLLKSNGGLPTTMLQKLLERLTPRRTRRRPETWLETLLLVTAEVEAAGALQAVA
jgi:hypothetical protein